MHMSFWWDYNLGDLFVQGISIHSVATMFLACGFMTILTIIYEGLKVLETKKLQENDFRIRNATLGIRSDDRNTLLNTGDMQIPVAGPSVQSQSQVETKLWFQSSRWIRLRNVLLFSTNNTIKYMMMLAVMLYNGYLTVSIIIGVVIGYFLFGSIGFLYQMKTIFQRRKTNAVCLPDCEENGENGTTPPLIQGRGGSEGNIETSEFEIHSHPQDVDNVSDDIDIRVINKENEEERRSLQSETNNLSTNEVDR